MFIMAFDFFKRQSIDSGIDEFRATEGAVLLDVRSRDEYVNGHVPGSIHFDAGDAGKAMGFLGNKETPLFVYCYSGARSNMTAQALKNMGYRNVKNIGGINSYTGKTEKGA